MKLYDVYPLFDINIVKVRAARYGTTRVRNISTFMAVMPLSASAIAILTM